MPRRTLRARLTLIYGGLFLLAGIVLLGLIYLLFTQQLRQSGSKVVATGGPLAEADHRRFTCTDGGVLLTGSDAEHWLAEQRDRLHDAATTSLLTQGGIALGAVGGAAAGFGWLVAGRVLAPLHGVTGAARRIAARTPADHGLRERIALRGPADEVKDLADAFDTMVERLDRSFDGQRRFVANASHELRTPLTVGRSLVELAMRRDSASPELHRLGAQLLEINSRHERLIAGLLLLARSDNELTERHPVDLADLVSHAVEHTAAQARAAGITVRATAAEALTSGDAMLLERLVHNLLDNAIRHNTGPGGEVHVTTRTTAGARLEVSNTGPHLAPAEIPTLFEPFRRLTAGPAGTGLGLSIVEAIVRAHGGSVTAEPRPGGGLTVRVTLP